MAEVIEVNDIHELGGHRLAVSLLLDQTPRASFFDTVDWLEACWKHFGAGLRLRAMVVRAAGQTIGVAPFVVRTRDTRLGPQRVLSYPLGGARCWCGPLGGNQAATLALAFRQLRDTPRDWDLIDLPGVDHQGQDRGRTRRMLRAIGWRATASEGAASSFVEVPGSYREYLASRSRAFGRELLGARRRVAEAGAMEFVRHRPAPFREGDGDPRWDLYEACEQIPDRVAEASTTTSPPFAHNGGGAFLRDAHAAAARRGEVDLCLLKIDGRVVAYAYNYHRSGLVVGLSGGADTHAGLKDAGLDPRDLRLALSGLMIEDSCRRGDRRIELGGDDADTPGLRTGVERAWRVRYAPLRSLHGGVSLLRERLAGRLASRVG